MEMPQVLAPSTLFKPNFSPSAMLNHLWGISAIELMKMRGGPGPIMMLGWRISTLLE